MSHKLSITVQATSGKAAAVIIHKVAKHLLNVAADEWKDGIQIPVDFTKREDHACGSYILMHDTEHEAVNSNNLLLGFKSTEEQVKSLDSFVRLVAVDVGEVTINGKHFVCCVVLRSPEVMKAPSLNE